MLHIEPAISSRTLASFRDQPRRPMIDPGRRETVLITHGKTAAPGIGRTHNVVAPTSLAGQFKQPLGADGPVDCGPSFIVRASLAVSGQRSFAAAHRGAGLRR